MYAMDAVKKITRLVKEERPGINILVETHARPKKGTTELKIFFTGRNPVWVDERWRLDYEFDCDWENDDNSWTEEMVNLEVAKILALLRSEMWRLGINDF